MTMMDWAKRIVPTISGIALITGIIFGVGAYETKFATADDIKRVMKSVALIEERLENKIIEDRLHALQQRMWVLEDRYGGTGVPKAPAEEIRTSYRELKYEACLLEKKIGGGN